MDDGEAAEAFAFESHHLFKRCAPVHAEVVNDPVQDLAVRLNDGVLPHPLLDVGVVQKAADVLPPLPPRLRCQKVELPLDSIGEGVWEAVRVAEASVGVPRACLRVDLFFSLLGQKGGFELVSQAGAQRYHLHAAQLEVELFLLSL